MESYKLAVEMADRLSARRAIANAFFLTVHTTLVAVVGLRTVNPGSALLSISVCTAGLVVAACWWLLLENYRRLNEAKFAVINKIEIDHLPIRVFGDEWALLVGTTPPRGLTKVKSGLKQLGGAERIIPPAFALLYIMVLIGRMG